MNIIKRSVALLMIVSFSFFLSCNAQIENARTETVKIYGNCGMCEKTIEKAGNLKKTAIVNWNKDTKIATVTYDTEKTNQAEILKRIALAGYDSDSFLAPNDAYNKLPECCRYERSHLAQNERIVSHQSIKMAMPNTTDAPHTMSMPSTVDTPQTMTIKSQELNQVTAVFDNYFGVKDALVKTNGKVASGKSKILLNSIKLVQMDKLPMDVHTVWMKVLKSLQENASFISGTSDVAKQRNKFMNLTKDIYALIKVAGYEESVYFQHCPMYNEGKDADWLSKEKEIKNPYYGSEMLNCGSIVEKIE